jgi:hypothetical protein
MSLAEMVWTRVPMHSMVLAWLRAERDGYVAQVLQTAGVSQVQLRQLLDKANIQDADENRARLRLLYWARNLYVLEIPPDTEWYEVCNLKHEHIGELLAVNHEAWTDPSDRNELPKVAVRKGKPMRTPLSEWQTPILWGHHRSGPFTIIEGNNRLASYARSGQVDLDMPVFIGLSPMKCLYHLPDQSGPLIRDMFGGCANPR